MLNKWYMAACVRKADDYLYVRIRNYHYFRGDDIIYVQFNELHQLCHMDALDKSLMSCLCLWVILSFNNVIVTYHVYITLITETRYTYAETWWGTSELEMKRRLDLWIQMLYSKTRRPRMSYGELKRREISTKVLDHQKDKRYILFPYNFK